MLLLHWGKLTTFPTDHAAHNTGSPLTFDVTIIFQVWRYNVNKVSKVFDYRLYVKKQVGNYVKFHILPPLFFYHQVLKLDSDSVFRTLNMNERFRRFFAIYTVSIAFACHYFYFEHTFLFSLVCLFVNDRLLEASFLILLRRQ